MSKNQSAGGGKCFIRGLCSSGRPRSESSRVALLETAYTLMAGRPIHAISTQEIASKAGVSTATVYRWWPSKEALLLDAFLHVKKQHIPMREEGRPLERFREHIIEVARFMEGKEGRVAARLLAAIQDNDGLRKAFVEQLYLPQSKELLAVVQEAVHAGDLPTDTDAGLLIDTIFGTILVRLMIRHELVKRADIERAFDFAVAGAMALVSSVG